MNGRRSAAVLQTARIIHLAVMTTVFFPRSGFFDS
jgi:hypothetical protein